MESVAHDRYRIERTLGGGGMAVVYLAVDEELDRQVAVKVLPYARAGDGDLRERFLREARLAGSLAHPNIVRIFDAGESDGGLFIVMEYVPGRTLAEVGKVAVAEAVQLALQAAAGLQHAHEAGLVHRDVKPANLLLRADGILKVADFGIARAVEATRLTKVGTVLGTAAYLSPEQAAGEDVTPSSDVYALGAVLYQLLTGKAPYHFDSLAQLVELQTTGSIAPVRDHDPGVPEAVEAVVMRALARDPRFRPSSAAGLGQELAAAADVPTEPLLATAITEPLGSRTYRSVPGAGAALVIGAAAVVATVAVILGLLQLGDDEPDRQPAPAHVAPPPRGATPEAAARNLSAWLRAHSR